MLIGALGIASWSSSAAAAPPAGSRDYTVSPAPAWVATVAPSISSAQVKSDTETGLVDILVDDQLRVDRELEHYLHRVRKIASQAGLEHGAEISIVVDPSYERFIVHGLHVVRGDQRIDALRTATVRTLDTEEGREQHIYDGSRSVVFLLSDVRVGDVIDFEGTTVGSNPVFKGRVARSITLGSARPAMRRRVRVIAAPARELAFRLEQTTVPLTTRANGNATETTWEHDLPSFLKDGDEPSWYDVRPTLTFSEFASWADVARWAADLYQESGAPRAPLEAQIQQIKATHTTDEQRALAALRFVQDEVRYLGVELGEHSFRPHSASAVFEQRFGDCKDKVFLLLTMLHNLGIEAHAAMVDTDRGAHIADELPRPQAFNHAIARIRVGGRYLWVDPTRAMERGPLGGAEIGYGRALVASPDTTDLSTIERAPPTRPLTTVNEIFRLKGDAGTLDVTSTYRGAAADSVRYRLAQVALSQTRASYLEFYAKQFPTIEAVGDLRVEDDETNDVLVVRESYRVPVAVNDGFFSLWAHSLTAAVDAPSVTRRTAPLDVWNPLFVRHEIEVETDGAEVVLPDHVVASDPALELTMQEERKARGIRVVFELQSHTDSVAVADVPRHLAVRQTIRNGVRVDLPIKSTSVRNADKQRKADEREKEAYAVAAAGLFLLIALVVIVVRRMMVRARRWRWLRRASADAGQSPATAIRIATRADGERRVIGGRWTCTHARPAPSAVVWTTATLGDRKVSSARATCDSCGDSRVSYFFVDERATDDARGD